MGDLTKMRNGDPDWIVFSGLCEPVRRGPTAGEAGELVRVSILNARSFQIGPRSTLSGPSSTGRGRRATSADPLRPSASRPHRGPSSNSRWKRTACIPFGDAVKGTIGMFKTGGDGGPHGGGSH